jgi:transposase
MKPIFARELAKDEIKRLKKFLQSKQDHIKKRAMAIFLSSIHRYKVSMISKVVDFHPNHLRKWIKRFNKEGINVICNSPARGVKKKFDQAVCKKIVDIVKTNPRKLGLLFSCWTLHRLKSYIEENKLVEDISHETIRQILKRSGIELKKIEYDISS